MHKANQTNPLNQVVVGGSRGIGREVVRKTILDGHRAYSISRKPPEKPLPEMRWIQGDSSMPGMFMDQVPERVDSMTFCPGRIVLGNVSRLTTSQMMDAFATNVVHAFATTQAMLPRLANSDNASVVYISSVAAGTGLPNHCAISSAKAALEGLARAMAADLAPRVRVNVVAPTLTMTQTVLEIVGGETVLPGIEARHPLKRISSAGEIAAMINFLHSENAASITGQVMKVDGGLSSLRLNER